MNQPEPPPAEGGSHLEVSNLVSARTREGLVRLALDGKELAQLSVAQARDLAQNLHECAAVAETEAMLIVFLMDVVELDLSRAVQILADFRMRRGL
jgi:hypothetical protein